MSTVLRAEVKETAAPMTLASLRAALDELEALAGVPHDARLNLTPFAQGGWMISARWVPEEAPPEGPPSSQWSLQFEEDPAVTAARIQDAERDTRGVRRIKDNPQA